MLVCYFREAFLILICTQRRHFYWYPTEEGIEYLRQYLHLPEGIVPATHKKAPATRPSRPTGGRDREERPYGAKDGGPGRDFRPNFRGGRDEYRREGGFGRGGGGF